MREKLIEILRGAINTHTEKKEQWILGGKVGEEPMLFGSFADHLIANGVTVQSDSHWATEQAYKNGYEAGKKDAMKWISVKDRLPEKNDLVLCIGARGGMFLGRSPSLFSDGTAYFIVPNARSCRYATYWMPLPEPPKGE